MANSASAQSQLPIVVSGKFDGTVTPVIVTIDTIDTDLTIFDPDTDKHVGILGIQLVSSTATNITIKSGSTTLTVLQLSANSGFSKNLDGSLMLSTAKGEDLIIQASATPPVFIMYIVEYSRFSL